MKYVPKKLAHTCNGGNTFELIYPKQNTLGRKSITRSGVIIPFLIIRMGAFISLHILLNLSLLV